jgi:hypothetical protein
MKPKVDFYYVPLEVVDQIWDDISRILEKTIATAKGKYSMNDIYDRVMSREYVLWVCTIDDEIVAAITTRLIAYPNKMSMAMDWIGGTKMKEWLPIAQKTLQEYGRYNNCSHLEGYGRKAWGRWLQKYGWKPDYIAYRMEL